MGYRIFAMKVANAVLCLLFSISAQAAGINLQNAAYELDSRSLVVKGKLDGFAAEVPVTLTDTADGSVLGTYLTDKQFLFRVPYRSILDSPCNIMVQAGLEEHLAQIKNCGDSGQVFEFTLAGVVTDEPIPYATVSVTLAGVTYTTTADEFGNYELPILSSNLNQLLKIDASATDPETGDAIDFVSMTGAFARALDGNTTGNVTNVTTASYILTVEANGGTEPTTAEELQSAETSVDASELFELAALIKLIVDDKNYSLPDGETSLIEFISDPAAVEAYVETVPQEDLDAAMAEILSDSDLVAGFTPEDVPERYYNIPVASPGYIARSGDAFEFNTQDGTGSVLGLDGNSGQGINQSFTWSIDASARLEVIPDSPIVVTNFPAVGGIGTLTDAERQILADNGIGQIEERSSVDSYRFTRITDGTLVDIANLETRTVITYPDIPLGGGATLTLAQNTVVRIDTTQTTLRSSLDIDPVLFTDSCTGGNQTVCAMGAWGGVFHYPNSPGIATYSGLPGYQWPATAYGDIAELTAGGVASLVISGTSAAWSINPDGSLVISYPNGWTQTMQALDTLDNEYGVFSDFSDGTERFANYSVFVRAESRPVITAPDLLTAPGRYFNGEINSWIPGSFDENGVRILDRRFGWEFSDDSTGINRLALEWGCDGSPGTDAVMWLSPFDWLISPEGTVEIDRRPWDPGTRVRTWFPASLITVGGDRIFHALEQEYRWDSEAGGLRLFIPPRLNIQRELDYHTDYDCIWQ